MSEEVLLISNLTAQCKWLLRAISDRLLEPHTLDMERMIQDQKGSIPWKFMLSQLGRILRRDFNIDTDDSNFVPAAIGLSEYFAFNMEFIKGALDKLDFGKETS